MQSVTFLSLSFLALVCSTILSVSDAQFQLPFVNKFSAKAREQFFKESRVWPFPDPHTIDFHKLIFHNDAIRHGTVHQRQGERRLVETSDVYSFSSGNVTINLQGFLYFTVVEVGTPPVAYIVTMDTLSDLFWLPCECKSCAPSDSAPYGLKVGFSRYSPADSNTSRALSCSSTQCTSNYLMTDGCPSSTSDCIYKANYAALNTSSMGRLVEDVIYLRLNNGSGPAVPVPITLGCGQTQTGRFLVGDTPDGLIGLGLQNFSVPSTLAKAGIVQDSFSICFSADGTGTVMFGDIGSSTQQKTPLLQSTAPGEPAMYEVNVESITIGTGPRIRLGNSFLVDTVTSYTYLNSSVYQAVIEAVAADIANKTDLQRVPDASEILTSLPFTLCYFARNSSGKSSKIFLSFSGNATYRAEFPYISIVNNNGTIVAFCFGVVESTDLNLIGDMTLGFELTDCGAYVPTSIPGTALAHSPATAPAPAPSSLSKKAPAPGSAASLSPLGAPKASGASITSTSLLTIFSLLLVQFLVPLMCRGM